MLDFTWFFLSACDLPRLKRDILTRYFGAVMDKLARGVFGECHFFTKDGQDAGGSIDD